MADPMLWCSACHRALTEDQLRSRRGLPVCPHCHASAVHLAGWQAIRHLHAGWPDQPEPGKVYLPSPPRARKLCARTRILPEVVPDPVPTDVPA